MRREGGKGGREHKHTHISPILPYWINLRCRLLHMGKCLDLDGVRNSLYPHKRNPVRWLPEGELRLAQLDMILPLLKQHIPLIEAYYSCSTCH